MPPLTVSGYVARRVGVTALIANSAYDTANQMET
jgi:hypothetical protein